MKILLKSVLILFAAIFTTQKSSAQILSITNMTNCDIEATIYCYYDPGCTLAFGGAPVTTITISAMTSTIIPPSCGPGMRHAASLKWANCPGASTSIVGLEPTGSSCVSMAGATFYYPAGTIKMPDCTECEENGKPASVDYSPFGVLTITP